MGDKADSASLSLQLAQWIANPSAVPSEVRDKAKLHIIDTFGVTIGAAATPSGRRAIDLFAGLGGKRQAPVLGGRPVVPAIHAAYLNSFLANLLDFDDTHSRPLSHLGAGVVGAAVAAGYVEDRSGIDLIDAWIVGYEVALRVGASILPSPARYRQVWGFATWQIFGAAASAARLLRLGVEETRGALGMAAMNAPLPNIRKFGHIGDERPYGSLKNNYGWAAMGALLACQLAGRGYSGNPRIFEGDSGFWVMAGSDRRDPAALVDGLGERFLLLDTGFKPYACCRLAHSAVEAARIARGKEKLAADQVESILIRSTSEAVENLGGPFPTGLVDAQFHLPCLVALEILGRSTEHGLREEDLSDVRVRSLVRRVRMQSDAVADARFVEAGISPATVVVKLADGRVRRGRCGAPPWGPEGRVANTSDVLAKFRNLVFPVLGARRAQLLERSLLRFDEQDVRSVLNLVRPSV